MSSRAKEFALGVKLILARLGSAITDVARVMTTNREAGERGSRVRSRRQGGCFRVRATYLI